MKVIGLIPVRLESTRLPGKALLDFEGMPAIIHTYKRACLAKELDEVYICTDSDEIIESAKKFNCRFIKTGHHRNGSERIEEAAKNLEADIFINIQGDEVLVDPEHINQIADVMKNSTVEFSMGVTDFSKQNSPQDFKAVLDLNQNMLYCSREDIPSNSISGHQNFLKVCFTVGFTKKSLSDFVSMETTPLEDIEPNEFLRILQHGKKIRTVNFRNAEISLDTEEDYKELKNKMAKDVLKKSYLN